MKNYLFYVLISLTLVSCEKENIPQGKETKVSGKLSDFFDFPVTNAKVKISEFKNKFVSDGGSTDYLSKYIDSTFTNNVGEYKINFKSTGNGSSYRLIVENSPNDQSYTGFFDSVEIKNIGANFVFNYNQFTKLYPCDVTINQNNILILPIRILHDSTRTLNDFEITTNLTIIKRIYTNKYSPQILTFQRLKPNGVYQKAIFTFPASNSEFLTLQNITLNETDFTDY